MTIHLFKAKNFNRRSSVLELDYYVDPDPDQRCALYMDPDFPMHLPH